MCLFMQSHVPISIDHGSLYFKLSFPANPQTFLKALAAMQAAFSLIEDYEAANAKAVPVHELTDSFIVVGKPLEDEV